VSMVDPVLELSSTAAVRAAVAAGAGPAALSVHAVRDDIASGRLVPITVTGLDLTRRLHAVWTGSSELPAGPVRDLVTFAERS
jgi:DNA-binding transcriptional LysR family regulator